MNKLVILFLAVFLVSCAQKPKGSDSKIPTEKEVSDFIRLNPNWTKADDEATERFKLKMIKLSNEPDFLKDIPFKYQSITDTVINTLPFKMAEFVTYKDSTRDPKSLLNDLDLKISGIVSDELIAKLKADQKYYITGSLYKQGKRASVNLVESGDAKTYLLGKYVFLISTIKPVQ